MLSIGRFTGTITENALRCTGGGTPYVNLLVQIGQDQIDCKIWLTNKALHSGMAAQSLAKCGVDIDHTDLCLLGDNPKFLVGRKIPVSIQENEYNGQTSLQCSIELSSMGKDQISKIQDVLRNSKSRAASQEDPITDEDIPF